MTANESNDRKHTDERRLPEPGEPVWVQCQGYRTLAVRDEKGKWRTVGKGEELTGPVKVLEQG